MVTKFERLKARVEALGGTLTKHDSMITPWGWKHIKYDVNIKDVAYFRAETLKELERSLDEIEKDLDGYNRRREGRL